MSFWQTLPKHIIALAPMAGYTDSAFRFVCRKMGAHLVYSEMISATAICYDNQKTMTMLDHDKKELPLIFQLFGNNVEHFAEATRIITTQIEKQYKNPEQKIGLDINFGCPARKVVKNGSGSALMGDIDKSRAIIKAVTDNTHLSVSIKIRTEAHSVDALTFLEKVADLPWQAVMVHGRTLSQLFTGDINYDTIRQIKEKYPEKIVLGNGSINSIEDARLMLEKTGVDGIGVARGAWGNPWLFQDLRKFLTNNKTPKTYLPETWNQRKKLALKQAQIFLRNQDDITVLRKHLIHYTHGLPNARELRAQIINMQNLSDLKKIK